MCHRGHSDVGQFCPQKFDPFKITLIFDLCTHVIEFCFLITGMCDILDCQKFTELWSRQECPYVSVGSILGLFRLQLHQNNAILIEKMATKKAPTFSKIEISYSNTWYKLNVCSNCAQNMITKGIEMWSVSVIQCQTSFKIVLNPKYCNIVELQANKGLKWIICPYLGTRILSITSSFLTISNIDTPK